MSEWKPIETAPKDGFILVWNGRRHHVSQFDKVDVEWVSSFRTVNKRLPIIPTPTHWQPLPTPPEIN